MNNIDSNDKSKTFSDSELRDETKAVVAGVFETRIYSEMLDTLTEMVILELEDNFGWENISEDIVSEVVENHMRRIWNVI